MEGEQTERKIVQTLRQASKETTWRTKSMINIPWTHTDFMHFIKDQDGQKTGEGVNLYDISGNKTRNRLNESNVKPTCDSTPMVQQSATIHLNAIITRSREQAIIK